MSKRIAYVTGGMGGIGTAICTRLCKDGYTVVAGCGPNSARKDTWLATMRGHGYDIHASEGNVSDWESTKAAFEKVRAEIGEVDVLVNNAGIAGPTLPVEEIAPADWDQTIAINLTGPFLCTRRAVPMLKQNGGGAIINISSVAGRLGFALRTPYSASKYGVIGLTETWAIELGPSNIRVNAVLPGIVEGPRQERIVAAKAAAYGIEHEEMRARLLSKVSLRRMVSAQDIANQILFLCSPAGAAISGQSLSVCGNVETLA